MTSHVYHISPRPMFHQQSVFNKQVQVSNRLFHPASSQAGTLLQILFEQTERCFTERSSVEDSDLDADCG